MTVATRTFMLTKANLAVLAFAALAIASQACTLASPTTVETKPLADGDEQDSDATEPDAKTSSASTASAGAKCDAKLVKVDVSKLTACGEGKGHCYAKSKTPNAAGYKACDKADEVCVSDTVLTAGGGKLTSCKVAILGNAAGACVALGTMPDDDRKLAEPNLKQDACADGEVCAPCQNPQDNNSDTGLCGAVGVSDADCGGASGGATTSNAPAAPAPTCCGGKGTCLNGAGLGEAGKDMKQDSCSAGLVCAPQSLVSNKAQKCQAGAVLGKGICMNGCFNDMLNDLGGIFLDKGDTCDDDDLCVPCTFASKMAPDGVTVPGCE